MAPSTGVITDYGSPLGIYAALSRHAPKGGARPLRAILHQDEPYSRSTSCIVSTLLLPTYRPTYVLGA
ncbi:hypothetical protein MVEN_00099300 [Mycena venus]|uniref:Uncharacterized protein n=1 Tax=Mycena venus TaxID=2733690 RepID=A0A8H7DGL7_9AGAR|nr:hypothetical protein MVEN_00099300 [Mycena venus]